MLFGDRAEFAIEARADDPTDSSRAVWGSIGVWCRGTALGRVDEGGCALLPARSAFARLGERIDDGLWSDELAGGEGEAVWAVLEGFWDRGVQRFDFLTNWGESFDGFKSYVVSPPQDGRLWIVSQRLPGVVADVAEDATREAAAGFVAWFDAVAVERLS